MEGDHINHSIVATSWLLAVAYAVMLLRSYSNRHVYVVISLRGYYVVENHINHSVVATSWLLEVAYAIYAAMRLLMWNVFI